MKFCNLSLFYCTFLKCNILYSTSVYSIDTLLEVNAAHDSNSKLSILNESTETIDFGVI